MSEIDRIVVMCRFAEKLSEATEKHPEFPQNPKEGLAIISEEFYELVEAMLKLTRGVNDDHLEENIIEEAYHVAVTAIRFIEQREKK